MNQSILLSNIAVKKFACDLIMASPFDYICTIKKKTRSLESNAMMWAMLGDVSKQVEWYGRKLSSEDWKHIFSASLSKMDTVPGIDGGIVVLGQSTSSMTISQMHDLIELISAFGADKDVEWSRYD